MNKAPKNIPAISFSLLPVEGLLRPQNWVRVRRRKAFFREVRLHWDAADLLGDTLTEMGGLARNPNATGAYAGSF